MFLGPEYLHLITIFKILLENFAIKNHASFKRSVLHLHDLLKWFLCLICYPGANQENPKIIQCAM